MPSDWPANVPGPRKKAKKAKKSSGGGNGTTVGMAILLVALPAAVMVLAFSYIIWIKCVTS